MTAARRLLVLGPAARSGGSLRYCREALPRIVERWDGPVTLALPPAAVAVLPDPLRSDVEVITLERSRFARGPLHVLPSLLRAQRILRSRRPDVVLSIGNIAYAGPRTPTVALLNNAVRTEDLRHAEASFRAYVALLRAGYRSTALRAARAIAVSHHMRDVTPTRLRRKGTAVIHHGVSVDPVRDPSGCEREPSEGVRILLPGSVVPYRGLERVLAAIAADPTPGLRIVVAGLEGSGRYERRLRQLVEDAGLAASVEWRGALPHAELLREMALASHVIISSRVEACPSTLLEAAALDPTRPVIAFDDPWSVEYADLLDARTSEAGLVDAIRATTAGSSPATVVRRSEALGHFTWDRCADETVAVLRSV